jgi:hypothetical protein
MVWEIWEGLVGSLESYDHCIIKKLNPEHIIPHE